MLPSLGATTGRVTSLASPEEPEGGTQGRTPRWRPITEWEAQVCGDTKNMSTEGARSSPTPSLHINLHLRPSPVLPSPPDICHSLDQE